MKKWSYFSDSFVLPETNINLSRYYFSGISGIRSVLIFIPQHKKYVRGYIVFVILSFCQFVCSLVVCLSGPGCSKLTTSLVNDSLKFQTLISQICQYFLLKKCEKLLQCKSFSHFFNKKFQCIWL